MHLLSSIVFLAIHQQLQTGGNKQMSEVVQVAKDTVVAQSLQPFALRKSKNRGSYISSQLFLWQYINLIHLAVKPNL